MKKLIFLYLFSVIFFTANAQNNEYKVGSIAFYNLENLFDTVNNIGVRDTDFTPNGENRWTTKRYKKKLNDLAKVISEIGTDLASLPPAIIGVSEVENRSVLEDLVKTEKLKKYNYQIIHKDSPDKRGIDCALLYMPQFFKAINYTNIPYQSDDTSFRTRDQLLVSGIFDGEPMHIIVNHWPSRSGGEKRSRPKRNKAGEITRQIIDSVYGKSPNAKIIVMGDFNDDPTNQSMKKHLQSAYSEENIKGNELFNPYYYFFKKGIGSLAYHDAWNNFDQILVSKAMLGKDKSNYKYYKANIFAKNYMKNKEGRYKGYPKRTFAGGAYQGGYSDHFPVYILIVKEK